MPTPTSKVKRRGLPALVLVSVAFASAALGGCRNDMQDQPRFETYQANPMFADSASARPLIAGTVSRTALHEDSLLYTGHLPAGEQVIPESEQGIDTQGAGKGFSNEFPFKVTRKVILRGEQRFNIYCSPCHGRTGMGNGMIVQRGMPVPPNFHSDQIRSLPAGFLFDVITNGFARMFSYAARVKPEDRWAIAAYIRTLQYSQHAPISELSPEDRQKLENQQ